MMRWKRKMKVEKIEEEDVGEEEEGGSITVEGSF